MVISVIYYMQIAPKYKSLKRNFYHLIFNRTNDKFSGKRFSVFFLFSVFPSFSDDPIVQRKNFQTSEIKFEAKSILFEFFTSLIYYN